MNYLEISTIAGASLLLCAALIPLAIRVARRVGMVDLPGTRRLHSTAVPRIGGVPIAGAVFTVAAAAVVWADLRGLVSPAMMTKLVTIGMAGSFIFFVGLVDDVRSVPSKFKALALLTASAAVCGAGVRIDALVWDSGTMSVDLSWLSWPVTMFWIGSVTVAIAFIDGMDGLAAGVVAIASSTLVASCIAAGEPVAAILPLALSGALMGFVLYNANPAMLFMGDSGSLTIGFLVACASVAAASQIGAPRGLILPALALSVPLMDLFLTIFRRRFVQRQSIFSAEMGHIHHNMAQLGLSQTKTVMILCLVSVAAVAIGEISFLAEGWATLGGLSLLIPLLLGLFHAVGSVRVRGMVHAVKRKWALDKEKRRYDSAADEIKLRLRSVIRFSDWWQAVCDCADALSFTSVTVPVHHRDGRTSELCWKPADDRFAGCETLNAVVPIRDRREGRPLRASVQVAATTCLESAGHRLALFSRLMADHSVAELPDESVAGTTNGPWTRDTYPDVDKTIVSDNGKKERKFDPDNPRIAVVHDFLYVYGGAERVLEQILAVYPNADVFSLFDFLPEGERQFLGERQVTTSFLQKLPFARKHHRKYLPLMPLAIEQLDLSDYDLVISSSYMAAKGVITGPDQVHVCYCHSPVRYAWDLQHQYLAQNKLGFGPKAMLARAILHYIRNWDVRSANGVDHFVANSHFVARRIRKFYRRDAEVIYPPVSVEDFEPADHKGDFYVCLSRLVPYKRTDLVVQAFNRMPDHRLVVIGDGPEYKRISALAGQNVRMMGHQPFDQVRKYLMMAKATIFAAEEDFGIVPVESMACGTPVLAYGKGGATETIVEGKTGMFFDDQTPFALMSVVERFERQAGQFDPADLRAHAMKFEARRFREELERSVQTIWRAHVARTRSGHDPASPPPPSASADPPITAALGARQ